MTGNPVRTAVAVGERQHPLAGLRVDAAVTGEVEDVVRLGQEGLPNGLERRHREPGDDQSAAVDVGPQRGREAPPLLVPVDLPEVRGARRHDEHPHTAVDDEGRDRLGNVDLADGRVLRILAGEPVSLRVVEHLPRQVSELRHGGQANSEPEPSARLGLAREAGTEASQHGAAEDRLEEAAADLAEVRRDPRLVAGHSPGLVHQPDQLAQPVDVHAGHHDRFRRRRTDRRAGHPGGQARCDPLQDDLEVVVCESFHGTPRLATRQRMIRTSDRRALSL